MRKMKNSICKCFALACVMVCLLALSGCAALSPSVEDLLRAPVLAGDYSEIQAALMTRFNSSVQLKYPTEGDLLSPYAFGDWDGDGDDDAVVLFTMDEGSSTVLVAILVQTKDGGWSVVDVALGLSDTVTNLELANMQEGDAQQIVVGFLAQGERYLAVYSYQDGWLNSVLKQPYSQYLIEDITGTGTDDLIVISDDEKGTVQMELLSFGSEGYTQTIVPSFLSEPFTGYANITAGVSAWGRQYLIVDGFVGEGETVLATEMLWYNSATGLFEETELIGTSDLYNDSKRYSANLISIDIDDDSVVEVPVQLGADVDGVLNHVQNRPITIVAWMDFTQRSSQKSMGLFDDEYNYYLALPDELTGNLLIVDGEASNSIEVRNLAGDILYFTLRVVDFDENATGWVQIGTVASKQIQVKIGEETSSFLSAYTLSQSLRLL